MTNDVVDFRGELKKIFRISDMLCTAHNVERDRFRRWSRRLDVILMLTSLYLLSMAFIDPALENSLRPANVDTKLWTGVIAFAVFGFSVVQLLVDWKGRADAHNRSFRMYAATKSGCAELLNTAGPISQEDYNRVRAPYDMASEVGFHIPDDRFLRLKQLHKKKVYISRELDNRPFMSLWIERCKLLYRQSFLQQESEPDETNSHGQNTSRRPEP